MNVPVLGSSGRNPHRTATAVNSLHLNQRPLLVRLVGEADKAVATALTRDGIRHDLGRLAAGEASLEQRNQDILVHLGAEVTNKDGVLGAAIVTRGTLVRCAHKSRGALPHTVGQRDHRQKPSSA